MMAKRQQRGSWRVFKKDPTRTKYTIEGRDHLNVKRRSPAFRDKALSEDLARNVAKIVDYKRQNAPLPPMLTSWVQDLAPDIRDRLAGFGLLDAHVRPLSEHLTDYEAALRARGSTDEYVTKTIYRINRIINGCKIRHWSDAQGSTIQTFIADLKRGSSKYATAQTKNYYLRDFKGFARWCVRDGRLVTSPVEHLKPLDASKVRNDRRHERRALSLDEVERLLKVARDGPDRYGMTGPERAMLYRLAIESGLRASELRSLTRSGFDLDGPEPSVTVLAAFTKNRQHATLPLRLNTAEELRDLLTGKLPPTAAFNMPATDKVIDMLKADLADAGIPYRVDPKYGKVADFHSLRHTCGSWLAAAGVHPKVIQRIMRHSTITLIMDRYTHLLKGDEAKALAQLPDLSHPGDDTAAATGTHDAHPDPNLRGAFRGAMGGKQWTQKAGAVDSKRSEKGSTHKAKTPVFSDKTHYSSDKHKVRTQCRHQDSNLEPRAYESLALPIELCRRYEHSKEPCKSIKAST